MAYTEYTGKSGATTITYGGASVPTGWRKIVITEKGRPLTGQLDKTKAGDAAYAFMDDPLGGKGSPSASVKVDGFLSVTDHQDTGLLASAINGTGTVIVQKATGKDKFTLTAAYYNGMDVGAAFADVQPFSATFVLAASTGVWSAS
jgi:hypothetical protein